MFVSIESFEISAGPETTTNVKSVAFLVTSTSTVAVDVPRVTVTVTTFLPAFSVIAL